MGKLTDILGNGGGFDDFRDQWDNTEAADEFGPLPSGEYVAHIVNGELEQSRSKSTPGYKLDFKVIEGDHAGRHFWHDVWLTAAALPQAKRDLGKIGVTDLAQLEQPLPRFIRVKAKVVLRRDDDGTENSRVRRFDVLGIDEPEKDEFAPDDDTTEAGDNSTDNFTAADHDSDDNDEVKP
ncbi:MAG: DUF669 domain-containing protein [Planctomycetes bacterium]|nr:DUF669 domain-containing protein [Planctomycetota bacterium]